MNESYDNIESDEEMATLISTLDDSVDLEKFAIAIMDYVVQKEGLPHDEEKINKLHDAAIRALVPGFRKAIDVLNEIRDLEKNPSLKSFLKIPKLMVKMKSTFNQLKNDLANTLKDIEKERS